MANDSAGNKVSLVCSLPSPQLAARRAEIQRFIAQANSVVPRPDGVLFAFENTAEIAHALVDFILFEQQCCSSIAYELRSEPRHSQFILQLRAPVDQVVALQTIYLKGDRPDTRWDGTMAKNGVARTPDGVKRLCNVAGPIGAVVCAVICLGLPIVSAALGVAGMSVLRDDRILIPFELLCCGAFLWTLEQGRRVHRRSLALWLALIAAGALLGSMFIPRTLSRIGVVGGCAVLVVSMMFNRRSLKRCS